MSKMIIDIKFNKNETLLIQLQELFNDIGPNAIFMDHYELAQITGLSPLEWKEFITDSRVVSFINSEMQVFQKQKAMSMLRDIENTKNTGQAQLLNTLLNKTNNIDVTKEGPIFIYTFIPPNAQEQHAKNVEVLNVNPFKFDNE